MSAEELFQLRHPRVVEELCRESIIRKQDNRISQLETALKECVEALEKIMHEGRWSADVITGLLGPEKDGPWCIVDHKHIDHALTKAKALLEEK